MASPKRKVKTEQAAPSAPIAELEIAAPENIQQPTISLNDIRSTIAIISAASSRGAFKADELTAVGSTYDRLVAFVTWHEKTQQEQPTS